jgi:hypothetical protein
VNTILFKGQALRTDINEQFCTVNGQAVTNFRLSLRQVVARHPSQVLQPMMTLTVSGQRPPGAPVSPAQGGPSCATHVHAIAMPRTITLAWKYTIARLATIVRHDRNYRDYRVRYIDRAMNPYGSLSSTSYLKLPNTLYSLQKLPLTVLVRPTSVSSATSLHPRKPT